MSKVFTMRRVATGVIVGSAMLADCTDPKSLYQWGGCQPQVHQYFKDEAREAQVAEPERGL